MAEHRERRNQSILCFDYGLARIGVATAHLLTGQATPVTTLACKNGVPDWGQITQLVNDWQPNIIVVGNPGTSQENKTLIKKIDAFCKQLYQRYNLKVCSHDESLSSYEAYDQLRNMRKYRHKKISKEQIDQLAAALILQSWIDHTS